MRLCVLGSGSKGNATFVEAGEVRLLVDAGFSGVEIERRLADIGVAPDSLSGILLTHEHGDHVRGVQALARRHHLPVLTTPATREAAGRSLSKVIDWQEISAGNTCNFLGLLIHPFSVSHDAVDPLGFVIRHDGCTLGYCTDTGITSKLMHHRLSGCNGLVLECNHDPEMLKNGSYPHHLQQRIRSREGHLTNSEAARFLVDLIHDGLEHVVLAHLSECNNTPELALQTVREHICQHVSLSGESCRFKVSLAHQDRVGEMIGLGRH